MSFISRPLRERFDEQWTPEPFSGCHLWTGAGENNRYGFIHMGRGWQRKRQESAHRASWILNRGEIPAGMFVLHKCDTPCCVNPDHLFLGTPKDNTHDCIRKGRFHGAHSGADHHMAKVTPELLNQVRSATGIQREIAERFGISQSLVSEIKNRRTFLDQENHGALRQHFRHLK